jgi:hypothetical protein
MRKTLIKLNVLQLISLYRPEYVGVIDGILFCLVLLTQKESGMQHIGKTRQRLFSGGRTENLNLSLNVLCKVQRTMCGLGKN